MNAINRALTDTFGHIKTLVGGIITGLLSLGALYTWKGRDTVIGEIPYVATGLIGVFGGVLLLFFWNLACAPYRLMRDRATSAED